jgi:23S rRNA G2445 N2-methylase RlmL
MATEGTVACRDAKAAGVSHLIKWHSGPCSQWKPRETPSTVVVNPPWGLRLLNDAEEEEEEPAEANRWFAGDPLHTCLC